MVGKAKEMLYKGHLAIPVIERCVERVKQKLKEEGAGRKTKEKKERRRGRDGGLKDVNVGANDENGKVEDVTKSLRTLNTTTPFEPDTKADPPNSLVSKGTEKDVNDPQLPNPANGSRNPFEECCDPMDLNDGCWAFDNDANIEDDSGDDDVVFLSGIDVVIVDADLVLDDVDWKVEVCNLVDVDIDSIVAGVDRDDDDDDENKMELMMRWDDALQPPPPAIPRRI
ncbi:hypothetical protein HDU76_011504 [Blyttiomyces sp. JEL0837]|nr:hypothetical protein HDU76_011504 [Blyttiomyces sp. JEL0837]